MPPESHVEDELGTASVHLTSMDPSGSTTWDRHYRYSEYLDPTAPASCRSIVQRSIDASFYNLAGAPEGVLAYVSNNAGSYSLHAHRVDLRTDYDAIGRVAMEPMFEEELTAVSSTNGIVAMSVSDAETLPLTPGWASGSEHGMALLQESGDVMIYAQEGATLPYNLRRWPTGYELSGTIAAPILPSGVTERHYCDVELLPDGDVVATFAQGPAIPVGPSNELYFREGWVRYDRATGSWEDPVTSYFGTEFLHSVKNAGFELTACMSANTNIAPYEITFVSNFNRRSSGSLKQFELWNFKLNASGIFSLLWYADVPTAETLEGVALLSNGEYVVIEDNGGFDNDHIASFKLSGSSLVRTAESTPAEDLMGLTAMPVESNGSCERWVAFAGNEYGPTSTPGDQCASFYELEMEDCSF